MKVKEQLIEEIVDIMAGEMQATSGTKRGRKAKANFLTGEAIMTLPMELSSIIQAREQQKYSLLGGNMGYLSLHQDSASDLIEFVEKKGFLLSENGVFYFFDDSTSKSMVYVPAQLSEKFDLKVGDKVLVNCQKMPGNNIYLGKDIFQINGCDAKNYKRDFCQFENFATSSTKWFCNEVTEGELKIISSKNVKEFLEEQSQLIDFCNQNKIFVVFISVDFSMAQQEKVENAIKLGEVMHAYSDSPENCFEVLINSINNAIIRAQSGQKVLLVLFDFDKILRTIQDLTHSTNLTDKDVKNIVSKIQNLNRILKNNGSLTNMIIKI